MVREAVYFAHQLRRTRREKPRNDGVVEESIREVPFLVLGRVDSHGGVQLGPVNSPAQPVLREINRHLLGGLEVDHEVFLEELHRGLDKPVLERAIKPLSAGPLVRPDGVGARAQCLGEKLLGIAAGVLGRLTAVFLGRSLHGNLWSGCTRRRLFESMRPPLKS